MEKLSPNLAQLFVRNKYTVFTMGGTVALRSVNKKFPESYSSAATPFPRGDNNEIEKYNNEIKQKT